MECCRSLAIQRNRAVSVSRHNSSVWMQRIWSPMSFPDQIACQENITGQREVPDHPLVNQTIHDCLTEAMDIDELEQLIAAIENKELTLVAKIFVSRRLSRKRSSTPDPMRSLTMRPLKSVGRTRFVIADGQIRRRQKISVCLMSRQFNGFGKRLGHPWAMLKSCMMRC